MLDSLHIQNFRCFEDLTIPSLGRVNLIVGKNSVGKSSLLEAIYIYSQNGIHDSVNAILEWRNEVFTSNQHQQEIFFGRECPNNNLLSIGSNTNEYNQVQIACRLNEVFQHTVYTSKTKKESISIVPTTVSKEDYMASLWDEISINSEDERIKDALKIITSELVNLVFVKSPKDDTQERIAIVKLRNEAKGIPLKSFGEGMSRILQIFLNALKARGGFLLIDEFENGLHYSIQEEVWGKLFRLATELNIQVFATTHSKDAIESFCKVADADKSIDGKLISLARSAKTSKKGKIFAVTLGEEELMRYVKSGMEVRG